MVPSARDQQTERVDVSELVSLSQLACNLLAHDAGRPYQSVLPTFLYWPSGSDWHWLEVNFKSGKAEGAMQSLSHAMRELNVVQFARLPTAKSSVRDQFALFATAEDTISGVCVRANYFKPYQFVQGDTYFSFDVVVRTIPYHGFMII